MSEDQPDARQIAHAPEPTMWSADKEREPVPVSRDEEQPLPECGSATEFVSFIPRFGDQPAYRIFECGACKALTWIVEAV